MLRITIEEARRFILGKQGLLGSHRFVGKEGALQYIQQAGCIQYDPVDVCGKNAELTLQSRVKGFTRSMLADLLYVDRLLVDYSDKELSIWSREDWPYFSGYRAMSKVHGAGFEGIPELEARAIAFIREHGPVSSDTLPIEGKIYWHSSMHWSGHWQNQSNAARSVLEQLYTDGVLLIHHKSGSRKYYDLAERYFSPELLNAENPCPDDIALLRWRIKRRVGAVGMLWNRRSDAWLGINMSTEQRNVAINALEADGIIVKAEVESIRSPLFFLTEDIAKINAAMADKEGNPRAMAVRLSILTGLRAGELCALHWSDIHEDFIHIHRQQKLELNKDGHREGFIELPYTKDERLHPHNGRLFPITSEIRSLLEEIRQLQTTESEFVIADSNGEWISKTSYELFLKRNMRALGYEITNNHAFRMSLNSNVLIPAGLTVTERASILGHSVETNERFYSHLRSEQVTGIGRSIDCLGTTPLGV